MRALGLFGSLAIGGLITLGASCGSDDDDKGDGGTGAVGGSSTAGGSSGGGTSGGGGSAAGGTGGGSGASTVSCDNANMAGGHLCWTWDASNVPSPAQLVAIQQMACTQAGGTAVTTCPTSGAVGKCTFTTPSGGYTVSQTVYYYAPLDRSAAMQLCMAGGGTTATWTPL
jgi:hypothetical protein